MIEAVPRRLADADAAAVRALAAEAEAVDGAAPLSEQPLLRLAADRDDVVHLLARDADGGLVGYAQLDTGAPGAVTAELVVAPGSRRRGLGSALLARARAEATGRGTPLHVWSYGGLPAARALADREGLAVVRELWIMRRDLGDAPPAGPVGLPAGVTVRTFVPGEDEEAWLRLNRRAFAGHPEQGRVGRADLDALEAEPWFDPAGFFLAERDDVLLGAMWTKVHPAHDDTPAEGEIYVVGVDPDAQGLGLGRALTRVALDHLAARGLAGVLLYTEGDNTAAIRTYERAGFHRADTVVMFGWLGEVHPAGATMGG